jgi:hypothetical protein
MNCKFLRGSVENLWVRYSFKKMAGKKGDRGQGLHSTLGGVAIFLRSVENLWDV